MDWNEVWETTLGMAFWLVLFLIVGSLARVLINRLADVLLALFDRATATEEKTGKPQGQQKPGKGKPGGGGSRGGSGGLGSAAGQVLGGLGSAGGGLLAGLGSAGGALVAGLGHGLGGLLSGAGQGLGAARQGRGSHSENPRPWGLWAGLVAGAVAGWAARAATTAAREAPGWGRSAASWWQQATQPGPAGYAWNVPDPAAAAAVEETLQAAGVAHGWAVDPATGQPVVIIETSQVELAGAALDGAGLQFESEGQPVAAWAWQDLGPEGTEEDGLAIVPYSPGAAVFDPDTGEWVPIPGPALLPAPDDDTGGGP